MSFWLCFGLFRISVALFHANDLKMPEFRVVGLGFEFLEVAGGHLSQSKLQQSYFL